MKTKFFILTLLIVFVAATGCRQVQRKHQEQTAGKKETVKNREVKVIMWNDSLKKVLSDSAFKVAQLTARVLGKKVHALVAKKGAEYAVDFCSKEAMRLTDSISKATGLKIRRLAKKYRNPKNETLGKDSLLFKKYVLDWLGHQPLKETILPDEEGHPVYYNPIKVKHFCLTCHGEPGKTMDAALAEKIKKRYPDDKATGFKEGQLRGMWAITFPGYVMKRKQ